MKELITEEQAQQIILWLSIAVTFFSLAFAFYRAPKLPKPSRKLFWVHSLLCALVGPAIWGFWKVYNPIEDYYGLDSLKALKINFLIAIGIAIVFAALFLLAPRLVQEPKASPKKK